MYRIGQLQETKTYEMVVAGTIEENMMEVKKTKENEISGVVQGTSATSLSLSDLTLVLTGDDSQAD